MNRRGFLLASAVAGTSLLLGCKPSQESVASAGLDVLFAQKLPDLNDEVHALEKWRGQPLVVNFWATWCAPCVREMPDLDRLQAEFPNVRFIGIGVDRPEKMREFVQKVPVSYPLLEARASGLELMHQLGNSAGGLPFTLVVTAQQKIARAIEGQIDPDQLRATLQSL